MDTKIIEGKRIWENFIASHPEANFLQSWYWGQFQEELGRTIFRVGFFEKNTLDGVMFCYIETSRRGKFLVLPGGPIINWKSIKHIKGFEREVRRIASENNCAFVRVRPQLEDTDLSRKVFKEMGFAPAPMYLHAELTSQLQLNTSEDEILTAMRKSTRHDVKKAQDLGISISDEYKLKNIVSFIDLQDETAKRQKFVPFSRDFLTRQFEIFISTDYAKLYTATYENQVLAQAFIIFYGQEAVYHYGASTEAGRKYPGAYLIQWEAIKEAKRRGLARYNFWGVAPEGESNHRFSGLSLFKRGFGGEDVAYLPAHDLVLDRTRYAIDFWIEKIRRKIRRS